MAANSGVGNLLLCRQDRHCLPLSNVPRAVRVVQRLQRRCVGGRRPPRGAAAARVHALVGVTRVVVGLGRDVKLRHVRELQLHMQSGRGGSDGCRRLLVFAVEQLEARHRRLDGLAGLWDRRGGVAGGLQERSHGLQLGLHPRHGLEALSLHVGKGCGQARRGGGEGLASH